MTDFGRLQTFPLRGQLLFELPQPCTQPKTEMKGNGDLCVCDQKALFVRPSLFHPPVLKPDLDLPLSQAEAI